MEAKTKTIHGRGSRVAKSPRSATSHRDRRGSLNRKGSTLHPSRVLPTVATVLAPAVLAIAGEQVLQDTEQTLVEACQCLLAFLRKRGFQDIEWESNTPLHEVYSFLKEQLLEIEDLSNLIYLPAIGEEAAGLFKAIIYDIDVVIGHMLPCDFLLTLRRNNPKAHQVSIEFFRMLWHRKSINLWGDEEEMVIEWMADIHWEIEQQTDPEEGEILLKQAREKDVDHYCRTGKVYANICREPAISLAQFRELLNAYHPRKPEYIALKELYVRAMPLLASDTGFLDFMGYTQVFQGEVENGEIEPYRYIRCMWDNRDHLAEEIFDRYDDIANGVGIVPPVFLEQIDSDESGQRKDPAWLKSFIDFTEEARPIFEAIRK